MSATTKTAITERVSIERAKQCIGRYLVYQPNDEEPAVICQLKRIAITNEDMLQVQVLPEGPTKTVSPDNCYWNRQLIDEAREAIVNSEEYNGQVWYVPDQWKKIGVVFLASDPILMVNRSTSEVVNLRPYTSAFLREEVEELMGWENP